MLFIRSFSLAVLGALVLSLTACGGGGEDPGDGALFPSDDPGQSPPEVFVYNFTGRTVRSLWIYESYTGHAWERQFYIAPNDDNAKRVPGLSTSQYDISLILDGGSRWENAETDAQDPYNGEWYTRALPRANPGEEAHIYYF